MPESQEAQHAAEVEDPLTVCVTGAGGFIGSHLMAALAPSPGISTRVLLRSDRAQRPTAGTTLVGDLRDLDVVRRFITPGAVVVHLAHDSNAAPGDNLAALTNLMNVCRAAPAGHFILCSSIDVHQGSTADLVVETTQGVPTNANAIDKQRMEEFVRERLAGCCGFTILRPAAALGRGGKNLCSLVDAQLRQPVWLNTVRAAVLGARRLHLVAVENVVAAMRYAIEHRARMAGETYIVSDDDVAENNNRDVVAAVRDAVGLRPLPRIEIPLSSTLLPYLLRMAGRANVNPRQIYSARKLASLGYRPAVEFLPAIRTFASWHAGAPRFQ